MPIYEYRCAQCGHFFEKLTAYSQAETIACPRCAAKAERLFSTFATASARSSHVESCSADGYCPAQHGQNGCGCSGMCCGH